MRLFVADPMRIVYEGNVKEVILPGEDGELSVLDFHQSFLYCLKRGDIKITLYAAASMQANIIIKNGVAKMQRNELTIIVET